MPSVVTEARQICPELTPAIKALDSLAYSRQYSEVFYDFIDWLVFQHLMPPSEENPIAKYKQKEQALFLEAFKNVQEEIRKRVNMWMPQGDKPNYLPTAWYDPLGRLYECITSKYKSSAMGQYFTPEPVVNLMTSITINEERNRFLRVLDPACGSGRMGIAAGTYLLSQSNPCWITMNDLDSICTKMTAVNMALHGIVGESICMDGLDITGKSFRFAYQVAPVLAFVPQEQWEFYRMMVMMKTRQDVKKQYVLCPIPYEKTFLKQANDRLLEELKERQKIADTEKREQAIEELKDQIKERMKGTLFADDDGMVSNIKLPSEQEKKPLSKPKKKKDGGGDSGEQGSLF